MAMTRAELDFTAVGPQKRYTAVKKVGLFPLKNLLVLPDTSEGYAGCLY